MQAIQFQKEGRDVIILEQDPISERNSNGYGISYLDTVHSFMEENDRTSVARGYPSSGLHVSVGKYRNLLNFSKPMQVTSWGFFYRILRANFDGYVSEAVPNPPGPSERSGKGEYRAGKRVTAIKEGEAIVSIEYSDVLGGEKETIETDLLIGADGYNSTIRSLVGATFEESYSGYIVWRAMVKESEVSEATQQHFASGFNFDFMWHGYMLCYRIPTDQGKFGPGEAILNYVIYANLPEGSAEMKDIFTDTKGTLHQNTVPRGAVRPEVWDKARMDHLPHLAPPFAELLSKTDQPFVSKINDVVCNTPSHFGGKVLLTGDAFSTIRPHAGSASEQSAVHNKLMAKMRSGEITPTEWREMVESESRKFSLVARTIGAFGLYSILAFIRSLYVLISFSWNQKKNASNGAKL